MRLANPFLVLGLLIVVILALFYIWAFISARKRLEKFAQFDLLSELLLSVDYRAKKIKIIIMLISIILSVFALMRPQWGFRWEQVRRKGLDILIALDTSKSMLAGDVLPSRLERSKLAIKDLVKNLKGDRIGLIAFSGSAFLQCPLTVDYGGFLLALENINAESIPTGGTSLSAAIKEALKSYEGGQKKYKVLVIVTDGENHTGDALGFAERAKKEGINIFCIGIGSKEGDLIPLTDEKGQKTFLKDREGNVVKTRLDEAVLQKIALATDGAYVRSTNTEFGLDLLYKERLSKMEKRELASKMNKHYEERSQLFLLPALLLLVLEMFIKDSKSFKNSYS